MSSITHNNHNLLIEFLVEELPSTNLFNNIAFPFALAIYQQLTNFLITNTNINNLDSDSKLKNQNDDINSNNYHPYFTVTATPRRFGCIVHNISNTEHAKTILRKGPVIALNTDNIDANQDKAHDKLEDLIQNKALQGFMRSCNINSLDELIKQDGYYYAQVTNKTNLLQDIIANVINNALKKLTNNKFMRVGSGEYSFIRPVHNLLIMYDNQLLTFANKILGVNPNNYTLGHRFLSKQPISIINTNTYCEQLSTNFVISDFTLRKEQILQQLLKLAQSLSMQLIYTDELLNEVTSLVEYPIILQGQFAKEFLTIPKECLILSLAKHQRYFALDNKDGNISNQFLFVSNMMTESYSFIISGNERVLQARLSDAKFFYESDKKIPLESFAEKLNTIIYHEKLGTQLDRIKRIQLIALELMKLNNDFASLNIDDVNTAVYLMKFDLTTSMVEEFPELQGIMGKYYALNKQQKPEIAYAIEKHYYPRFSGDDLPDNITNTNIKHDTRISVLLALADKLELLTSMWSIEQIPTATKDPFALRRATLGIIRILLKYDFNLQDILYIVCQIFNNSDINLEMRIEIYNFITQRLNNYLNSSEEFSFDNELINCLHYNNNNAKYNYCNYPLWTNRNLVLHKLSTLPNVLHRLTKFLLTDNAGLIINIAKRINNFLVTYDQASRLNSQKTIQALSEELYNEIDDNHTYGKPSTFANSLTLDEEKNLYNIFVQINKRIPIIKQITFTVMNANNIYEPDKYNEYDDLQLHFTLIAKLITPMIAFFDKVLVRDHNITIYQNRIKLLYLIHVTINKSCNFFLL